MAHIVKFLNELRKGGVGPSGQITKLTTLLNAVKMMVISVPDDGGEADTKDMVVRAKVVETKFVRVSERSAHPSASRKETCLTAEVT